MELKKWSVRHYEKVCSFQISLEAGAEAIVPDLYPDISGIVDCMGQACVKEKQKREDKLEISGMAKAVILYLPENEGILSRIDVAIPFSHISDCASEEAYTHCKARLLSVDARAVNPRKVQVTAMILLETEGYAPKTLEIAESVSNCETLKSSYSAYMPIGIKEKSFTLVEELELSAAKPALEELLSADVRLLPGEARVAGNKVIAKGTAIVKLLYLNGENPIVSEHEFAFSQILEIDNITEGAYVDLEFSLTGMDMDIRASGTGEARLCIATLSFDAQAVCYMEHHFEAVTDLYSIEKRALPDFAPIKLIKLIDKSVKRIQVRETLECGEEVSSVVDVRIALSNMSPEGSVEAIASVLYLNTEGQYSRLVRRLPVSAQYEGEAVIIPKLAGEINAAPLSDGLELRFSVDFEITVTEINDIKTVSGVQFEDYPESSPRPSIILRRCMKNETLWDIAKRYSATRKELALANQIEDTDESPVGKLLLIPKVR